MSAKEIIKHVVRQKKLRNDIYCVGINDSMCMVLSAAGALSSWEDNHPGAYIIHNDLCGLPYVIDNSFEKIQLMTRTEYLEWSNSKYL